MPPKKKKGDAASKKALEKKKKAVLEDKTFGLKNKNKSKKVQQHIQSVTKGVMNSDGRSKRDDEKKKAAKMARKERKKAEKAEQEALFGEALMFGKNKKALDAKSGKVEAKGRDHDDGDEKKGGTSRAMKMMYQMDAKEMEDRLREDPNYVPTLEDEIESQRQAMVAKLKASGKKGTPVTPETFKAWQERKRKRHADEAKKMVEAELKKKKGGKGLSVLSGKDLFEYKKELFKDDDEALEGLEEEEEEEGGGKQSVPQCATEKESAGDVVNAVAERVQSDLFLDGDDDDLDDLDDLDDD
mmetsp:Transcript_61169/g.180914  ORF Transcript_61169/g.180914 Transcript_61169/m.180914 type:complete len:299 (-) Transcript_61169:156-1052(-)|eukprot:CAMPEP_0113548674 /NCGR_PEP_ID=MMETSP0015_2-20120614/13017_1 /TAXON_ID=2838 /ORGANISM="Odontella" /LENGTH=298 /DNA_ID=CAMNT_0000449315 /DNA_START=213 /DNA_END=1109 /DNA_ORIENTATION=- /assembly_acc=CAM_ASM_000160